jgi:hypothetical protein
VPTPLSAHDRDARGEPALRESEALASVVEQWVAGLMAGTGSEGVWDVVVPEVAQHAPTAAAARAAQLAVAAASAPPGEGAAASGVAINAAAVFESAAGRLLFIRCLNQWRGRGARVSGPWDEGADAAPGRTPLGRLARVLWWILDSAAENGDVDTARSVMILSETFHALGPAGAGPARAAQEDALAATVDIWSFAPHPPVESSGGPSERVYVRAWLRAHPLWRDERWWEEALLRSVRADVERMYAARDDDGPQRGGDTGPATPSLLAGLAGPTFEPGTAEWARAYGSMVFGSLGSFAVTASSFGVEPDRVAALVLRVGLGSGLPLGMIRAVLATAARVRTA